QCWLRPLSISMLSHMNLIYLGSIHVKDDMSPINEDSATTVIDSAIVRREIGQRKIEVTVEISPTRIRIRANEEVIEIIGLSSLEFSYCYFDGERYNVVLVSRSSRTLSASTVHVLRAGDKTNAINFVAAISTAFSKLLR
ncbi:hypothetical protein PFISCL1PPCAC_14974, partial [Pristionchus fissidentatus]